MAMELCTNGALREALKLNISWPLKVFIFRLNGEACLCSVILLPRGTGIGNEYLLCA